MIVGDELVTHDARLDDAADVEIRPVISGGRGRREVPGVQGAGGHRRPPPQRRVLPRPLRRTTARSRCERAIRLARDARAGRAGARRGVGRQGLARALGHPRPARLRGRRPLPRPRDRRLLRRVGALRPRVRAHARAGRCTRSTSPPTTASTIPGAAAATRRAPCGACGLSKRHLFNSVALEHGYDVVATGHNLDDEAAVLLGNVLRWETGYLGRQHPVLPAAPGLRRAR